MTAKIKIRLAKLSDLEGLLELMTHLSSENGRPPKAKAALRKLLAQPGNYLLVAEANKKLVGTCDLMISLNLTQGTRPWGVVENVVTHEEFRRQGIGHALLKHAKKLALGKGCYRLIITTASDERGTWKFYENAGFKGGVKKAFVAWLRPRWKKGRSS